MKKRTVKELISELEEYNPDAVIAMISNGSAHGFTIAYGHSGTEIHDGFVTKENCTNVAFYLDDNDNEQGVG